MDKKQQLREFIESQPRGAITRLAEYVGVSTVSVHGWLAEEGGWMTPNNEKKVKEFIKQQQAYAAHVSDDARLVVCENMPGPILVFVPLMEPDVQVEKMRQLLAYLTKCGIASSWAELAEKLKIQEWYLTDCAEGRRSLHPTIIEVISHRWDIAEHFWTAAKNASIENYLGKRRPAEKGEGHVQQLIAQARDPVAATQAMDDFLQAALRLAAAWPKEPKGGTEDESTT